MDNPLATSDLAHVPAKYNASLRAKFCRQRRAVSQWLAMVTLKYYINDQKRSF